MANEHNTAERNREIMQMDNIRIFYKKMDRAKYISHLDITRCMQRALKRAKLPVWYTQGFNPHMYMTFALPLSLGYESEYEIMDLRMAKSVPLNEIKERLNKSLPMGLEVFDVRMQENKVQTIQKANYEIEMQCSDAKKVLENFQAFCAQEEINVTKRTKKGEKIVDIKSDFELISSQATDDVIKLNMNFSAGIKNINPTLLLDLFIKQNDTDAIVKVLRKKIYMENTQIFL